MEHNVVVSESLLEHAKREMEEAYAKAHRLRDIYHQLGGGTRDQRQRMVGMRRWRAIYEVLQTKPERKAAITDILADLQRLELDLGKYPLRTVKNAVSSPFTRGYFRVEKVGNDEVVQIIAELGVKAELNLYGKLNEEGPEPQP